MVCVCAKSLQTCLTLWDPMDCSPPGSSVHWVLQVRIMQRVAMPSSRGSSQTMDRTLSLCLLHWQTGSLSLVPPANMMDGWIKEFWALSVGHHLWPIVNPWMRMNTHLQPCPNPHFMSFYLEYHQVNCGRMVQRYPLFSFCLWVIQQASTWGHGLGHRHRDPKVTTMSSAIHICLATLLSFFMPPFILTFWTVHTIYCLKGNNLFFLFFVFFNIYSFVCARS